VTKETRMNKLTSNIKAIKIIVSGHEIIETTSERLQGLLDNNRMPWELQLYGNSE
jgi:hypothetical protein